MAIDPTTGLPATMIPGVSTQQIAAGATAVSDIFAGFAEGEQIQGAEAEQQQYELAAGEAGQEAQYTVMSTALQTAQEQREINLSLGKTQAQVAGAGLSLSGSALDVLRSSAAQGALQKATTQYQGLITQQGYEEQQAAYQTMANAAGAAIKGDELAQIGSFVGAGISLLAL
jgi:hypothetical protein